MQRRSIRLFACALLTAVGASATATAHADTLRITLTGNLTSLSDPANPGATATGLSVGSPFSLSFLDDTSVASTPFGGHSTWRLAVNSLSDMTLTMGGSTWSASTGYSNIACCNVPFPADVFQASFTPGGPALQTSEGNLAPFSLNIQWGGPLGTLATADNPGLAALLALDPTGLSFEFNSGGHNFTVSASGASAQFVDSIAPVPLPASVWLMLSGLAGLVVASRRQSSVSAGRALSTGTCRD